jgi:hypothetical protein
MDSGQVGLMTHVKTGFAATVVVKASRNCHITFL